MELSKLSVEEEPRAASVKVTSDTAKAPGFADVRIMFGLCSDYVEIESDGLGKCEKMTEDVRSRSSILLFPQGLVAGS